MRQTFRSNKTRIKMKPSVFSLLFTLTYSSLTFSSSENFQVRFFSRNMPSSCEYVFTVESDLRLELPLSSSEDEVFYQLQNTWNTSEWTAPASWAIKNHSAQLTIKSMSIPENYLYRNIVIVFPKAKLSCATEFGRIFGESCMHGGRDATPWRARSINCQEFE